MVKIKSDLDSYLRGSPHTTESEKFLYTLKGYIESEVGVNKQTIKINFLRLYEESINRIKYKHISEEVKQNQIRRLEEIKAYAECWERAQEIFKFFFERQLAQHEVFKTALLNYLELMAKQEMLTKAIFLLDLIKLLDEKIIQIEHKIKELEKKSQMIQTQIINIATQLVIDSLPSEIKNSPQADIIRERFAKQYSAALSKEFKSTIPLSETNKTIVTIAEQIVLKSFVKDPKIAASYHDSLNEKVKGHQNLCQKLESFQEDRNILNQQKVELQKYMKQKNNVSQELAKISPEIQALARSISADKTLAPEQPKQDVLPTLREKKHDSTFSIFETFKQNGESISLDFSSFEDESQPPSPPSPEPPQPNISENSTKVEELNDKETTESNEEQRQSINLKPGNVLDH